MRRFRIAGTLATLVTCTVLAFGVAGPGWATSKVVLAPYAPFPKAALTLNGASLARPTHAQIASVRVSASRAYALGLAYVRGISRVVDVGLTRAGNLPKGAKVTVRLGLLSDTKPRFAVVRELAYAVIFDGLTIPKSGFNYWRGGHEFVVIVNATTGSYGPALSFR